jgi:hypothetical protein
MRKSMLSLSLAAALFLGQGCTSAQLAADENKALAALQKLDGVISSGAALADAKSAAAVALAVDPSSPLLQKASAAVNSSQVASDLNKAGLVVKGAVAVLGGTPVASK